MSELETECLRIMRKYEAAMSTRTIRIAVNVFDSMAGVDNEHVLKALKRLRSKGHVVSERIDNQLYWEITQ